MTKGASIFARAPVFIAALWGGGGGWLVGNAETRGRLHARSPSYLSVIPVHGRLRLKPISTLLFTFGCCRNQGHRHYHENELQAGTSEPEIAFTTSIRPTHPSPPFPFKKSNPFLFPFDTHTQTPACLLPALLRSVLLQPDRDSPEKQTWNCIIYGTVRGDPFVAVFSLYFIIPLKRRRLM